MQLRELVGDFSYRVIKGGLDTEVTSLTCDSRSICPGCLFVCIHGQEHDGHRYIKEALEGQAAVLVTERLSDSILSLSSDGMTILLAADTKKALARMSARYYGEPAKKMTMIGITGTKGKTTTAHMLRSILEQAGYPCGLIGTNGWEAGEACHELTHTTPPACELHAILQNMYRQGCRYVIMEVSSIGVKEKRTEGIRFSYGIFTNLFRDHIGGREHGSFAEYRYWKQQFFAQCDTGIFNTDDPQWSVMAEKTGNNTITYGQNNENAQIRAVNSHLYEDADSLGSSFDMIWSEKGVQNCQMIKVPIPGAGNSSNALGAASCSLSLGILPHVIAAGIAKTVVKGRAELVCSGFGVRIWIDYAHNGGSLQQILTTLRAYHPKRLICLFGCGGCRSRERRYPMGKVSGSLADMTILTEDNSREEDPHSIIEEIRQGVEDAKGRYTVILDRTEAIAWAVEQACAGDWIVLAGKGHETYQEKNGVRTPFSEHSIVKRLWQKRIQNSDASYTSAQP